MAGTFKFELVSPERVVLAGDAEEVQLPGSEGDMTILPGHAPVLSTLRPGVLTVELAGKVSRIFVRSAFAEVQPDRVTVLADKAIDVAELDASMLSAELAAAEEAVAEAKDDAQRFMADAAVSALGRLKGTH